MDREGKLSMEQGKNTPRVSPNPDSPASGGASNTRKPNTKPRKKKADYSKKKLDQAAWTSITQIAVAVIGVIGTITAAWFGYQANLPKPAPVAAPSATLPPTLTPVPVTATTAATELSTLTSTPSPIILPSFTSTMTAPATPSETITPSPQPKLIVLLEVSKTSGKAPLIVKLDARASYLTDYDGQRYVCRNGACYYIWKVYGDGQQIGKSVTNSGGTFDYKFGKRGTYMITVWVCRGRDGVDCGGSGAQIIVTR